jgi:asparagine synthase (glutamine-hydrolysing)
MTRIAGVYSAWPVSKATRELDRMLGRYAASAPQTSRVVTGHAVLGAAVKNGAAIPIATRGPLSVVVDGLVFNSSELGTAGTPVAEIILALYEKYGFAEALTRINGEFAMALHDAGTDSLWLGRDRAGVRPLYFTQRNGVFAFASQPGALTGIAGASGVINRRFVALFAGSHYRTFDNAPEESPYDGIGQLPAGHIIEMKAGRERRLASYWTLQEQPDFSDSEQSLAKQYRDLLVDAVSLRLAVSESPAFLLSGGMDSSSVLAGAVNVSGAKQHAFSSVYDDRTYDESAEIRSMLDSSVKEWHPIRIDTPDIFSIVDRMVRAHDEPVATATWLSHYLLCEEAAKLGFDSLFGGLGGDELNAGEYEHFFFYFADLRLAGEEKTLRREVELWASHHDHPIHRKNMTVVEDALRRLVDLRNPGACLVDRVRLDRYAAAVNPEFFDLRGFTPIMDRPFRSYLKNRTFQDIFRETAPCCLRAEDRQSSAFGLQHFDPFFDYRLIEFMFRVPGSMKIRDGVTKALLRHATKGLLPEETRTRIKKTGWNAPAHVWFSGAALDAVRDMVASRVFRERGVYDIAAVTRIIDDHQQIVSDSAPRENHMMFIWQLVNLELWLRSLDEKA